MRLVLLHGFTGAPESWDGVLARLPDGTDVFRPYLLGHDPDGAIASLSFEDEVERLARKLREGHPGSLHLAGYSQGGRLAVGLLVRHPDLFAAATLIGASPGLVSKDERRARRAADEELARLLEEEGLERFLETWESLPLFATQRRLPEAVIEAQRRLRRRHRPDGLARALRLLGSGSMPSYWADLARIETPVLLMAGGEDEKFRRTARRMSGLLPRAAVEIVPAAGHNLLLEAPGRVAAALARGLAPTFNSFCGKGC